MKTKFSKFRPFSPFAFFAPLFAALLLLAPANAQVLLQENFTFTGLLTNNGWVGFSGTNNFISAGAPQLSYPNLPSSGAGNSAGMTNTGQDAYRLLTATNSSGDIYTSFLVNLSSAGTGDYFYSLYSTNSSGGGYFTRVFAQTNSTGFSFGVSRNQSTNSLVSYETTVRSFSTTYLVVAKMSRAAGVSNDIVSLWVNPALGAAESVPTLTNNSGADNTNSIAAVALRQGTTTPGARVGNILVGTTWASVTPASGGPVITSFTPTSGPAGSSVVITGSNFSGATSVAFNGTASASFTVDSATQITATVPSGASTGPISVTTALGTGSSSSNFTITGGPIIDSFAPSAGAAGTSVVLSGSNFTGATAVSFNSVAAASFTVDSATQITATVPAGATTGPIGVTTPGGSISSVTNFVVPSVTLSMPSQINEGVSTNGTVILTPALATNASNVVVNLSSSSPSDLVVPSTVTVPAGTNSSTFNISAPLDRIVDSNVVVTVTPAATGYVASPASITVRNVDFTPTDLNAGGYTQNFASFTNQATLPPGWGILGSVVTYGGDWGTGTSAGTRGNASVFGYQHTGSTDIVQQVLTLKNNTGAAITALTISYNGRVARATEGRSPAYVVYVDGQEVPALAYSTSYGDNFLTRTSLQGLNIADQATFTIVWTSDGSNSGSPGSGNRRQIGLSDVSVTLGFTPFPPSLTGTTVYPQYVFDTTAEAAASVTGDGGSPVTANGFVFALASVTNSPVIGGAGVTDVPWGFPGVGAFGVQLSPLTPSSTYSVRAYAINSVGTNYSAPVTFTTTPPNPEFNGLYTQNFNGFTNALTFPAGWKCYSSSNVNSYAGEWSSGSGTGGFYGTTNEPGVLGYQHTISTGTLINQLTLKNVSGSTITNLYISYLGMVTNVTTNTTRFPAWSVTVDDGNGAIEIPELAYSTGLGTNAPRLAQWSNASVPPNGSLTITWSSGNGDNTNSGSSRRIGVGFVQVATSLGSIVTNAPVVTSSNSLSTSVGEAVNYQITASGGATGFWATNLPGGLNLNKASGLITGAVTNTNRTGSTVGLVAYNAFGSGEAPLALTIGKGTPSIVSLPSASTLTNGQALSNSILTGGTASVAGIFGWSFPATIPALGTSSQQVTFLPTDSANYNTTTGSISVTVIATGETFSNWSGGLSNTPSLQLQYAIGGASSPTATDGIAMSNAVTSSNLSITAIVRTNDPNLSVFGQAVTDLTTGPWSTNNVTMQPGDQTGVGEGLQRQIWSTPRNSDPKKFLRLQTTLSNQ